LSGGAEAALTLQDVVVEGEAFEGGDFVVFVVIGVIVKFVFARFESEVDLFGGGRGGGGGCRHCLFLVCVIAIKNMLWIGVWIDGARVCTPHTSTLE